MRRGFRRGQIRRALRHEVPPMLQRAHELMANGNFAAAAEAFEALARGAEARQLPRTPNLFLQAGRARILAEQKEIGLDHLKHGLELMARMGLQGQLFMAGNRVVNELNEHGMTTESQEIAAWLKTVMPSASAGIAGTAPTPAKKPILPTHCPGCGGPVRADEVDWLDDVTAECNWCGNPVRAEG
jgi:hypothetical protein